MTRNEYFVVYVMHEQAVRVATQYAPPLSSLRRAPPSRRNVAVPMSPFSVAGPTAWNALPDDL